MEFIKIRGNRYLVKNSNGKIVSEEEKNEIEKGVLSIKSAGCEQCHAENHIKPTATSKKEKKKKAVEVKVEEPIEEVEVVKDESVEEADFII